MLFMFTSNCANWIISKIDRYILPVANPDGYKFSHKDEDNRMWRKTRQPNSCWYNAQPGKPKGIGTDANRNFGYKWGTGGSSNNPCMPDYRGEAPFSAPETANMRAWLTLHAQGQHQVLQQRAQPRPDDPPPLGLHCAPVPSQHCSAEKGGHGGPARYLQRVWNELQGKVQLCL